MPQRLAILLWLVSLAACSHAPPEAPSASAALPDLRPRVVIAKPAADAHVVRLPVALAEVGGAAIAPDATRYDVVLALDFSASAFAPTGRDVDGDGTIAVRKPWEASVGTRGLRTSPLTWTTDPDDSVAGAELAAARTLLPRLDPLTTRVGLVSFGSRVRSLRALSPADDVLAKLDGVRLGAELGGTNIARALSRSAELLEAAPDPGAVRSILLITDGYPTLPAPQARAEALVTERAEELARARIRVHVLAIASNEIQPVRVLEELARVTGGSFQRVGDPTELPIRLANTPLSPIRGVEVTNTTTGQAGLAVRVLPDGRFDGFVALVPGENVIEVRARSESGTSEPARRTLLYEPSQPGVAEPVPDSRLLLETLRRRTAELELLRELRERQQRQRRELEIEASPP